MSLDVSKITAPESDVIRPVRQIMYAARWLIILGVIFASRLTFPNVVVQYKELETSAVIIAAITLAFQILSRRFRFLRNPAISTLADIIFVSFVVFYSDGIQSPFYPLYYIVVISTAISFGLYGALVNAFAIALTSIVIEIIETGGVSEALVVADIVSTLPYLFLIALTSGVLRDRVATLTAAAVQMRAERDTAKIEIEIARNVQVAQLPKEVPVLEGVEIVTYYQPAREVGGDMYDFYPVSDERIGITIADVSGKGIPAALLVSASKCAVHQQLRGDLDKMMEAVNEDLFAVTMDETFVTMLYGMLRLETRKFEYVSAGHMPPIVIKANEGPKIISGTTNIPLGVSRGVNYDTQSVQLETGDILVLYTDGVTDALTRTGTGIDEFVDLLSGLANKDLQDWPDELSKFLNEPCHIDDATVVAIRIH